MYLHSLPPKARLMRRRVHQLASVRPVVPDVCPWPMRFQCCPTQDLAATLGAPAVFTQRRPAVPVSPWLAGMPHPTVVSMGALLPPSSLPQPDEPMHLLTPELEIWTP